MHSNNALGNRRIAGLGAEAGFAVPTVLLMLTAMFALASVTAVFVINTERGTSRDRHSKAALTAADSAVAQALLLYNQVAPPASSPCIGTDSGGKAVATALPASGWCPALTGTAGGGTFSYMLRPVAAAKTLEILATGSASGITRRIDVEAKGTAQASNPLSSASVVGLDRLYVDSGGQIIASAATNGTLDGGQAVIQSGAQICGGLTSPSGVFLGSGATLTASNCTTTVSPTSGSVSAPPLEQADIPTTLSNSRIGTSDPFVGNGGCSSGWNATTRALTVGGSCALTLRGTNYKFCTVTLNSTQAFLYLNPGARIFFESPESCGLSNSSEQFTIGSGSNVVGLADPADIAMYFVGSSSRATQFNLTSNNSSLLLNCQTGLVIYAPRTDVKFSGGAKYCGSIVAKTLWVGSASGTTLDSKGAAPAIDLGFSPATKYAVTKYTECSSYATGTSCN